MAEDDDARKKDDDESKDESSKSEASKDDDSTNDKAESSSSKPSAPPLGTKALRAFLITAVATFLTGVMFADSIPSGLRVHFDLLASIKLGLIAGVLAALVRTAVAMLPVFPDDTVGRQRKA